MCVWIILIASILTNNILLASFLGMCSFLACSSKIETAIGLGTAVTFVMVCTTTLNYLLYHFVRVPLGLEFLAYILFIAVIAAFVQVVEMFVAERKLANYGDCHISINKGETVFEQPGGSTLLAALYEHKIFIPSACGGKGSCGYCKVTVRSGGGPVLPTETPYLTRAEIRAGVWLACQVKVKQPMASNSHYGLTGHGSRLKPELQTPQYGAKRCL